MLYSLFLPIIIIFFLVLLNGFFVASEFAFISMPRATVNQLAAEGKKAAKLILKLIRTPALQDRYIVTAQVGISVASLGLGMYGEHVLAVWFEQFFESLGGLKIIASHTVASILAVTLLTVLHIVIGEMLPKSISLQKSETAALWIIYPMIWIQTIIYPLVIFFYWIGNRIISLLGIKRQITEGYYHTTEELQYIIKESEESGFLKEEAGKVLRDLFEFGDLTAYEMMIPRVRVNGIPINTSFEQLKKIIVKSMHTRYPVYEADLDHIIGMVHIKDILRIILEKRTLSKKDLRPVPFIPETSDADAIIAATRQARTHIAVVMDEHGGTAGLVTIGDIFKEVIGCIKEDNSTCPEIYPGENGIIYATGTARLEEIGEQFDIELEHEDVDTVSGLILAILDRPAQVGDTVEYENLMFTVTEVEGHGVKTCAVTREEASQEENQF